jgi:hypothetical protein
MARMPNPVSGAMEFVTALLGLATGGLVTIATDRYFGATHALVAAPVAGTTAISFSDTPPAGQVYNAVGPATPIWSNWKRLVAAVVNVIAPFGLSAWLGRGRPGVKSFFQLWGFSSLTVTTVKTATDGAAFLLGSKTWLNGLGPRLFATEIDAQNALLTASKSQLPAYTLVTGGTGAAPAGVATGSLLLGKAARNCPPGYAPNRDGACVPSGGQSSIPKGGGGEGGPYPPPGGGETNPPGGGSEPPPVGYPPPMMPPTSAPPPGLPPEGTQPPVYTQPPVQQPPYYTPPIPTPPQTDTGVSTPEPDCGIDACAGDCVVSCAPDKVDF